MHKIQYRKRNFYGNYLTISYQVSGTELIVRQLASIALVRITAIFQPRLEKLRIRIVDFLVNFQGVTSNFS